MLDLLIAAALAQALVNQATVAPDPADRCYAADGPDRRPGCLPWRLMVRDSEGAVFVDPASVRRRGNLLEVSMRAVYLHSENGTRSHVARARFDCVRRTSAILHLVLFDADGRRLDAFTVTGPPSQPRAVEPRAPGHYIIAAYCPRRN